VSGAVIRADVPVARGASEALSADALACFAITDTVVGAFGVRMHSACVVLVSKGSAEWALPEGAVHAHEVGVAAALVVRTT
jgi:predicted transcriptional regulator